MKRRFDLFLKDILEAIRKITEYTAPFDIEGLKEHTMCVDATIRNLEIIGEAVSQLPPELKEKYPEVPWKEIKDFRNVVVHKYHSIDYDILWDIVQNKLEILEQQIDTILRREC